MVALAELSHYVPVTCCLNLCVGGPSDLEPFLAIPGGLVLLFLSIWDGLVGGGGGGCSEFTNVMIILQLVQDFTGPSVVLVLAGFRGQTLSALMFFVL